MAGVGGEGGGRLRGCMVKVSFKIQFGVNSSHPLQNGVENNFSKREQTYKTLDLQKIINKGKRF